MNKNSVILRIIDKVFSYDIDDLNKIEVDYYIDKFEEADKYEILSYIRLKFSCIFANDINFFSELKDKYLEFITFSNNLHLLFEKLENIFCVNIKKIAQIIFKENTDYISVQNLLAEQINNSENIYFGCEIIIYLDVIMKITMNLIKNH